MARNFVGFTYGEQRNFNSIFRTGLWVLRHVEPSLAVVYLFCSDASHEKEENQGSVSIIVVTHASFFHRGLVLTGTSTSTSTGISSSYL